MIIWEEMTSLRASDMEDIPICKIIFESVFSKQIGGDSYIEQMREERQELYKVKTQVRDERNEAEPQTARLVTP